MPSLLILTVGTGASGQHSNLAQGLVNTLRQLRPRLFWLVPSASEKSAPAGARNRKTPGHRGKGATGSEGEIDTPPHLANVSP